MTRLFLHQLSNYVIYKVRHVMASLFVIHMFIVYWINGNISYHVWSIIWRFFVFSKTIYFNFIELIKEKDSD